MNKKSLKYLMLVVVAVGVAMALFAIMNYMGPNERQVHDRFSVDISKIEKGEYLELSIGESKTFILKLYDGKIGVFEIWYWKGAYRLADPKWTTPNFPCKAFGPEAEGNKLIEDGHFRCFDEAYQQWEKPPLWDFEGKSKQQPYEDMPIRGYSTRGKFLYLN